MAAASQTSKAILVHSQHDYNITDLGKLEISLETTFFLQELLQNCQTSSNLYKIGSFKTATIFTKTQILKI